MGKGARRKRRSAGRSDAGPEHPPAYREPASRRGWMAVALLAVVLLAYAPAIGGGFLWDDDAHVTRPELRSWAGLARIWSEIGATQQYYPLLHSAFWLEHRLWGNQVVGYHLVNLVWHAASAWLLFVVLRRLQVPGAPLAAALFALHPVHVESVAWISEQKNTLSLVFYLGALLSYLRFDEERRPAQYGLATVLFVLGLLTKTVVATLPGALLLILWWRRGTLDWRRDVVPLGVWLGLGGGAGLVTAWFESRLLGAEGAEFALTPAARGLLAGRVVFFYLGRLVWPLDLTFVYPRWTIQGSLWPGVLFPLAALAMLVACWAIRRRSRAPLTVALFFVGSLVPVLGFVNVYPFVFSFVADHFQYLPSLGILTALAALFATLRGRLTGAGRRACEAGCVAWLAALGILTWSHSQSFRDARTLYESTLARNPGCYLCLNNLGTLALEAGRPDEALTRYQAALQLKPDSVEALSNVGNLLLKAGQTAAAIEHYEHALRIAPNNVATRTNLGIALFVSGRRAEAEAQYEAALRIMPDYAPALRSLELARAAAARQGLD